MDFFVTSDRTRTPPELEKILPESLEISDIFGGDGGLLRNAFFFLRGHQMTPTRIYINDLPALLLKQLMDPSTCP